MKLICFLKLISFDLRSTDGWYRWFVFYASLRFGVNCIRLSFNFQLVNSSKVRRVFYFGANFRPWIWLRPLAHVTYWPINSLFNWLWTNYCFMEQLTPDFVGFSLSTVWRWYRYNLLQLYNYSCYNLGARISKVIKKRKLELEWKCSRIYEYISVWSLEDWYRSL